MSHFYGTVQGNRGEATRGGSKNSGLTTNTASWEGAVMSHVWYNEEKGEDWVTVCLRPWQGVGSNIDLYRGPISGKDAQKYIQCKETE